MRPILLMLLCLLDLSCTNPFAPKLNDSPYGSDSILGDQRTVEGVFQNFKQAYLFRDTTIYGQLLASNFIFVYKDYERGVDVFWGRDDDMRTTYGLFQNAQRLDLVWNSTIASNGDSLSLTLTRNFNLTVTFNASDIMRVDGYANISLNRLQQSDNWRITRWRDESNF
jgi:hypothetical protein